LSKIKNWLTALLATLAVGLGGVMVAAPAEAVWGSSATYAGPEEGWVKARNMNGVDKILHEGETANNVAKVMPPGSKWWMRVCGTYSCRDLNPGESYVLPHDGNFDIWLGRA
jgi:hypothetical protein